MSDVIVKSNRYTVEPLYQWDINQVLTIYGLSLPSVPEIHFTNSGMDRAIVKQATMDDAGVISADVPNSLLQKPYKITAYVCIYEGDTFKSLYAIEIPVKARKKPGDYTLENDEEFYSFNALENQIENLITSIEKHNQVDNDLMVKYENAKKELDNKFNQLNTNTANNFNQLNQKVTNQLDGFSADLGYLKNYVTPQMFGAVGDGVTDDTNVLNEVLSKAKHILFENGIFLISDTLNVESDTIIEMKNAKIISNATEEKKYIFNIKDKTNIKIIAHNSVLKMAKPNTAQQACISIFNSTDIYVSGLTLSDAGGDGVIVGGTVEKNVSNVDIKNCIIDNSRRNGISLVGGIDGLSIHDCVIKNTAGTSPQLGIDIETWDPMYLNKNIRIYNNRFLNNGNGDLTIFEYTSGVTIYNNHFDTVVSVKINTQYNGVIEANPTDIVFHDNIFKRNLYFYGIVYGGFSILDNIFDGGALMVESPFAFSLDESINSKSKLIKGNTFNNPTTALTIGYSANMLICENVVNDCRLFLSAWAFYKSVVRGNIINGYNVNGDLNRVIEFNGVIDSIIIENNTVIANSNTAKTTHIIYFKGGSVSNSICRNNDFSNSNADGTVGYDAQGDNIDYGNSLNGKNNICSKLPEASAKFAGQFVTLISANWVGVYVCTLIDGKYAWKELNFTT